MDPIKDAVNNSGEDTLDLTVDDLFKDPEESQPQDDTSTNPEDKSEKAKGEMTQVMIDRINTVKRKTEQEVLERVAKEQGYESYSEMKKAQEEKLVKDHGFDPKELEPIVDTLLKQRLADDPRLKKLEDYERRERDNYIQSQLTAINKTTGQNLKVDDLSKEVLDLWGKGVELEQAYYAIHGKTIISKGVSQLHNGTLDHLAPGTGTGSVKTRKLTEAEKEIWRSIVPGITEEELAKKTTPINN